MCFYVVWTVGGKKLRVQCFSFMKNTVCLIAEKMKQKKGKLKFGIMCLILNLKKKVWMEENKMRI